MINRRKKSRAEYLLNLSVASARKLAKMECDQKLADVRRAEQECEQLAAAGGWGLKSAIAGMMYLTRSAMGS